MLVCLVLRRARKPVGEVVKHISQFRLMVAAWIEQAFELCRSDDTIARVQNSAQEAAAALALLAGEQLAARAEENPALFLKVLQILQPDLGRRINET